MKLSTGAGANGTYPNILSFYVTGYKNKNNGEGYFVHVGVFRYLKIITMAQKFPPKTGDFYQLKAPISGLFTVIVAKRRFGC